MVISDFRFRVSILQPRQTLKPTAYEKATPSELAIRQSVPTNLIKVETMTEKLT